MRQSLIEWQIELLSHLLKQIVYHRRMTNKSKTEHFNTVVRGNRLPREEIAEKISMPAFAPQSSKQDIDIDSIELSGSIIAQLEDLVTTIAQLYHPNSFHNFEVRRLMLQHPFFFVFLVRLRGFLTCAPISTRAM